MSLSCALLFFIERLRVDIKTSFAQSISGTDLLVGPKGHPAQLLLSTVFHLGEPREALAFESLKWLRALDSVAWAVPISLGDSHGPYRVIGTEHQFFEHIRTGEAEPLVFTQGKAFTGLWEVVIGASVARQLGYKLDASIVLSPQSLQRALAYRQVTRTNHFAWLVCLRQRVLRLIEVYLYRLNRSRLCMWAGRPVRQYQD
jgi:putative ABC transport system permease protein